MIFSLFQIVAFALMAFYFGRWRAGLRRRNELSWDSLLARLRTHASAPELSGQFLLNEGLTATPEETWERIHGPHGLWAMYQNASVMLEMADFAARNSDTVDRELLETLRSDAMQIRACVLLALAKYACTQVNEGIRVNTSRAVLQYTGMAARMRQLLEESAAPILPEFVAAM
jgi:hypothetical protein